MSDRMTRAFQPGSLTRVFRTTTDGRVEFAMYSDLTMPPHFSYAMDPDEADEVARQLQQQARHARTTRS